MSTTSVSPVHMLVRLRGAFSGEPLRLHQVMVDLHDGVVRVWDDVGEHYTTCHSLSEGQKKSLIRLARQRTTGMAR